jgi:hypothetical protein
VPTQTIIGTILLSGESSIVASDLGKPCQGEGGYDDIRPAAQVLVTNAQGEPVATGRLSDGVWVESALGTQLLYCQFSFEIEVPGGEPFYTIEVSHRGELTYSAQELEDLGWTLALELG